MKVQQLAIQRLIVETSQLHERGEFRQAYQCSLDALTIATESAPDRELYARVLVVAARSAYYLSLFNKCHEFLNQLSPPGNNDDNGDHQSEYLYSGLPGSNDTKGIPKPLVLEALIIRANVLRRTGNYDEALEVLGSFSIEAGDDILPRLVIEKLLARGACRYYSGKLRGAREDLESALGLAIYNDDVRARARVLVMLGLVARSMGFMARAEDCFSRGREFCRAGGDSYGEAAALLNIAITLYHRGKFARAEKSVLKARSLFVKTEWNLGACRSLLVLGNIRRRQGEYSAAHKVYVRAGKMADRGGFAREKVFAMELSGAIFLARKDYRKAIKIFTESLHMVDEIAPGGDLAAEIHRRLGEAFIGEGKTAEAMKYLECALSLANKSGDKLEKGLVLRAMAGAKSVEGDRKKATDLFQESIDSIRASGCSYELARTHLTFAVQLVGKSTGLSSGSAAPVDDNFGMVEQEGTDCIVPDNCNKALGSLMEAGHLFAGTDDDHFSVMTDRYMERLLGMKRRAGLLLRSPGVSGEVITIMYSHEYMIAKSFVAVSETMLDVWRKIKFAGSFSRPVLITGETGTGKELVARLIHDAGTRAGRPFVAVNCAAIPDHLFESEFFGHRKGCFTGAFTDRRGIFEEADGGTIFLDEVGELSTLQQVKLLRVLQERKVRRLGNNIECPVDVRVISATNRDLEQMIEDSSFREDFFYRINAEIIHLDPLRSRPEDIVPLLAWRLCGNGNSNGSGREMRIVSSALKCLQAYHWPGNARELISVADRVGHMASHDIITTDMLPERVRRGVPVPERAAFASGTSLETVDMKTKLNKVMNICRGNKSAAAKWLGISRGTLYKQLRQAGLAHFIR